MKIKCGISPVFYYFCGIKPSKIKQLSVLKETVKCYYSNT